MSDIEDVHKSAQDKAFSQIAAMVGAQLEDFSRRQEQTTPVMNNISYASSIPPPKPINVKDGDVVENFKFFQLQWNNYLVASGANTKSEEVKKSILLSVIGDDCLKMYTKFQLNETDVSTEQSLLIAIGRNLMPVLNKRRERAIFHIAFPRGKETYLAFCNRLKKLITNCEYGKQQDDMLLDKLIASVKDQALRELLWEDPEITLESALEMCRVYELAQKQRDALKPAVEVKVPENAESEAKQPPPKQTKKKWVNRKNVSNVPVEHGPSAPSQPANKPHRRCMCCGNHSKGLDHAATPSECPAFGLTCKSCGFQNHLTTMCQHKKTNPSN